MATGDFAFPVPFTNGHVLAVPIGVLGAPIGQKENAEIVYFQVEIHLLFQFLHSNHAPIFIFAAGSAPRPAHLYGHRGTGIAGGDDPPIRRVLHHSCKGFIYLTGCIVPFSPVNLEHRLGVRR